MNEQKQSNGNGNTMEVTTKRGRKSAEPEVRKSILGDLTPIKANVIEVMIEADTDLIINRWSEKSLTQIREGKKGPKGDDKTTPYEQYLAARHLNEKGEDCVPGIVFKHAMVSAASFLQDATKVILRGSVFVLDDLIPLKFDGVTVNGKKNQPIMREDMCRIGNYGNRKPSPRYRPGYRNWSCKVRIQYDASVISAKQVVDLLNRAGFNCGIGEWRPLGKESSGSYGRFHVKGGQW